MALLDYNYKAIKDANLKLQYFKIMHEIYCTFPKRYKLAC